MALDALSILDSGLLLRTVVELTLLGMVQLDERGIGSGLWGLPGVPTAALGSHPT